MTSPTRTPPLPVREPSALPTLSELHQLHWGELFATSRSRTKLWAHIAAMHQSLAAAPVREDEGRETCPDCNATNPADRRIRKTLADQVGFSCEHSFHDEADEPAMSGLYGYGLDDDGNWQVTETHSDQLVAVCYTQLHAIQVVDALNAALSRSRPAGATGEANVVPLLEAIVGLAALGSPPPDTSRLIARLAAIKSLADDALKQLCAAQRPAGTREPDAESRLATAEARVRELEGVIRWALGEEGEFVSPPDHLVSAIAAGRAKLKLRPFATPLYWWRSELRRRAASETPERTET